MKYFLYIIGILIFSLLVGLAYEISFILNENYRNTLKETKEIKKAYDKKEKLFFKKTFEKLSRYNFINEEIKLLENIMKSAGFLNENASQIYWIIKYIVPIFLFLISIVSGRGLLFSICLTGLICLVRILFVNGRIKERNNQFNKCAYKIYKYLYSQVSSGIRPVDAMKSLYQIVDNKELSFALATFTAQFSLTQDFRESSKQLTERYIGREVESLIMVLEQGIKTGDNLKMLERQEQIMFDAYMATIQQETENRKLLALCAAVLYGIVAVFMISIPLVVEMINGFGNIFNN